MKPKLILWAILLLAGLFIDTAKAVAQEIQDSMVVEDGYFKYTVLSAKDHTLKAELRTYPSYNGKYPKDIIIPDYFTIENQKFTVVEVGNACKFDTKSVKFPINMKVLGKKALDNCSYLESVDLGNKLERIEEHAFSGCSNLESLVLPASVKYIGDLAFYNCDKLSEINLPASLDTIGSNAFSRCAFKYVDIPDNVTLIGEEAFLECKVLTRAAIGKNAALGRNIFNGCSKLSSLTLRNPNPPEFVAGWGQPLSSISEFSIYVPDESVDTYRQDKFWKQLKYLYAVSDPHEFSVLGLWYNKRGDEIRLISSLDEEYAGNVTIPETMIFNGEEIQCTVIAESAFLNCTQLTGINIPSTVKIIGKGAFSGCKALTDVSLPKGLTEIPEKAFNGCDALTSIQLPSSVVKVGEYAFGSDYKLEEINLSGLNEIGPSAFSYTKLKEVRLHCPTIQRWTFEGCHLENVILEEGVKDILGGAFSDYYNRYSISTVRLPKSIESIDSTAFNSVENIILSNDTPPAWGKPFKISSTSVLYVPKGTRELYAAADYWKDFPYIMEGDSDTNAHVTIDGVLYRLVDESKAVARAASTEISGAITILSGVEIGDSKCVVVGIPEKGFEDCRQLTSISIPSTIKTIGDKAFNYCFDLASVELNEGLSAIGNSAFSKVAISSIEIPSSVKEIGPMAFYKCSNLTSIELGNGVETIGSEAFAGALRVQKLKLPASLKTIGKDAFNWNRLAVVIVESNQPLDLTESPFHEVDKDSFSTLYVPKGTKAKYSDAYIWKDFRHMMEYSGDDFEFGVEVNGMTYWPINDYEVCGILKNKMSVINVESTVTLNGRTYRVTLLPESAFSTHQGIRSINIPYGVTTIGPAAMMMQVCLPSIELPNSIRTIGKSAFNYCNLLNSVTLGNSVDSIGAGAFDMCTALQTLVSRNPEPPVLGENVFNKVNTSYCTLRVPVGSKAKYAAAPQWKDFANIEEFGASNIFIIDDNTFSFSSDGQVAFSMASPGATEVTVPASITVSQDSGMSFMQTNSRSGEITTTYKVTSIAKDAFINCTNLKKLTLECEIPPFVLNDCFPEGVRESCELIVPAESLETYKSSPMWEEFANIHAQGTSTGLDSGIAENARLLIGNGGITSSADGTSVEVYSIEGRLVARRVLNAGEFLRLPDGIYIVRSDGKAIKAVLR